MAEILREALPDATISTSSGVLPELFEHERFSTTVANAVLSPLVSGYVARSRPAAQGRRLRRRAADPALRRRRDDAGGRPEARRAARRLRASRRAPSPPATPPRCAATSNAIGVDMGGTSTDISLVHDGELRTTNEWFVEYGHPICFPSIEVLTIGAGGGSLATIDAAGSLRNGPQSAGSRPGPGRLRQGRRGADEHRRQPRARPARRRSWSAAACRSTATPPSRRSARRSREPLGPRPARGGRTRSSRVANANMADAVRIISLQRGYDPREFALVVFGGAGALHGAALAEGARRPDGARAAAPGHLVGARLPDGRHPPRPVGDVPAPRRRRRPGASSDEAFERLEDEGRELLQAEGVARTTRSGSSARSPCATSASGARWRCASTRRGRPRRRGRALPRRARARVLLPPRRRARRALPAPARRHGQDRGGRAPPARRRTATRCPSPTDRATGVVRRLDEPLETPVYERSELPAGVSFEGPAVIDQLDTTTLVPPGRARRGRRVAEHPHRITEES